MSETRITIYGIVFGIVLFLGLLIWLLRGKRR
jgi:hypothetical protein